MDIIEFDEPFISDIEGVDGSPIEPNEPIWKLALSPANTIAMGLSLNELRLTEPERQEANEDVAEGNLVPPESMQVTLGDAEPTATDLERDARHSDAPWADDGGGVADADEMVDQAADELDQGQSPTDMPWSDRSPGME